MSGAQRRNLVIVTLLALVAALALVFALTRGDGDSDGKGAGTASTRAPVASTIGTGGPTTGAATPPGRTAHPAARPDWVPTGMRTVSAAALPAEARETLRLIAAGGPFPYARDGIVFGNRERLLPAEPTGHYREYTVPTPGSADRGARRIVAGEDAERYYSDDHYASFAAVLP
ncbi:ribonuclease domain-containing protein [Embleya sp. NBC_00896]|uniref:ribonuclease domain-containing protein n=1 Tax=Embleya sp. NBC_00896 TaxID=2975961 RepID=UPI003869679B|nr:guanine-specific ribonuclease N1 and T1 [Embleya sp. NBC_00896]